MKKLVFISLILIVAALVGLNLRNYPGLLVMSIAGWRIDAPLWLAVFGLILMYFAFNAIFDVLGGVLNTPHRIKEFSHNFFKKRAKKLTFEGLIALEEEEFSQAERALVKGATQSDFPGMNYLYAAKAAHALGATKRQERYLNLARQFLPDSIVEKLVEAKLLYKMGNYKEALSLLQNVPPKYHSQTAVLKILQKCYWALEDWPALAALFPKLKRYHINSKAELAEIEKELWINWLLASKGRLENCQVVWQQLPKALRRQPTAAAIYGEVLIHNHCFIEAEEVLRKALHSQWDETLIALYGKVLHPAPHQCLKQAEKWLEIKPSSSSLLLTLGRLCIQLELWGKAQRYLEASISLAPRGETYAELGSLFTRLNKPELATHYFKTGLLLTTGMALTAPLLVVPAGVISS